MNNLENEAGDFENGNEYELEGEGFEERMLKYVEERAEESFKRRAGYIARSKAKREKFTADWPDREKADNFLKRHTAADERYMERLAKLRNRRIESWKTRLEEGAKRDAECMAEEVWRENRRAEKRRKRREKAIRRDVDSWA
jgi:hypothetical protein